MRRPLIASVLLGTCMLVALSLMPTVRSFAQQYLWTYPFAGVQPQNSIDFKNPPLTFAPQGGVVGATSAVENVPIGSVAYASFGNATTYAASTDMYVTSIYVPADMTVTNINVLAGGTIGTNAIVGILYNAAGTAIGNSILSGTATSGANTFQILALVTPIAIQGPGTYYIGVQSAGATDNIRTIAASTFVGRRTSLQTGGVFGTVPALTLPTTFNANDGPIAFLN